MIFIGDLHGNIKHIFYKVENAGLKDRVLVQVGDYGLGFQKREHDIHNLKILDEMLLENNMQLYIMRGNHDDPAFFKGELKEMLNKDLKNITLVEDYDVHEIDGKKWVFIGGGVSIDRTYRKTTNPPSYWEDEIVINDSKKILEIKKNHDDIYGIVTHSAPMWCHPQGINAPIVRDYCRIDESLGEDLIKERDDLGVIFDALNEKYKFKYHIYGHYHKNNFEKIVDCEHILLGIGEFLDLSRYDEHQQKRKIIDGR